MFDEVKKDMLKSKNKGISLRTMTDYLSVVKANFIRENIFRRNTGAGSGATVVLTFWEFPNNSSTRCTYISVGIAVKSMRDTDSKKLGLKVARWQAMSRILDQVEKIYKI